MTYYIGSIPASDSLCHHGIKGMKWGRRRFENPDGTLTPAGKERYRRRKERSDRREWRKYANNVHSKSRVQSLKKGRVLRDRYNTVEKTIAAVRKKYGKKAANYISNRYDTNSASNIGSILGYAGNLAGPGVGLATALGGRVAGYAIAKRRQKRRGGKPLSSDKRRTLQAVEIGSLFGSVPGAAVGYAISRRKRKKH